MHTLVMACLVAPMLLLADRAGVTSEGQPTPAATMEQLWDMAYEDLRATGSMGRVGSTGSKMSVVPDPDPQLPSEMCCVKPQLPPESSSIVREEQHP